MRRTIRPGTIRLRSSRRRAAAIVLPLVVVCAAVGCSELDAADAGGGSGSGSDGGGIPWPSAVPRPDLTLVEETDLIVGVMAVYELGDSTQADYGAQLVAAGFADEGSGAYDDGTQEVTLATEGDRLFVTILGL